jgi:nicotinate-nucleotide adenylyltransferase
LHSSPAASTWMTSLRRVGVFGGMFDPVHRGHLQVASRARECLGLETVLLVPCGNPVHRGKALASNMQRIEMLQLAIADQSWLQLDTRECLSVAPSYTCDTLASLREQQPATSWHLVMGADAFLSLPSWKNWRQLFTLAHIVVVTRPGYVLIEGSMSELLRAEWRNRKVDDPTVLTRSAEGAICCVDLGTDDLSSTQVRHLIKTGVDTSSILHPAVAAYIAERHLYSPGGPA